MNQNNRSNEPKNMGFIDDYSNDSIHNRSTIRKTDGRPVFENPLENENKPKRKVTKMSRKRYRKQNAALFVTVFFLALITAVSLYFIIVAPAKEAIPEKDNGADTTIFETDDTTSENGVILDEIPLETEEAEKEAPSVTVSNEDVHKGNLILVNYQYEYIFPEENILVSMFKASDAFSVNSTETYLQKEALDSFCNLMEDLYENSGCDDVIVVSAFRSIEKQQQIYEDQLALYGSQYTATHVADPGYSEHHSGLALDLSVYADDGLTYGISSYTETKWFMENFTDYGFILRYPDHKASITGIDFESWHYRYVGVPHSIIMEAKDLCHEEYNDYLKDYTFDTKILTFNKNTLAIGETSAKELAPNASEYYIYYVPAADGDTTKIPLIADADYTVSGNNVDGFIITAKAKG